MKTALFFSLACASLALCNCQPVHKPAARNAAPAAQPMSAPVKSEALAPDSIIGKAVILTGESDATSYYIDFKNGGIDIVSHEKFTYQKTGDKSAKLIGNDGSVYTLTFVTASKGNVSGAPEVNEFEIS